MVKNFRYEQPGAIALSGVPETPEAVDWLHGQGIRAVVSLHPVSPEVASRLAERGIRHFPFPISDFAGGLPGGAGELLRFIREAAAEDPAVLVH